MAIGIDQWKDSASCTEAASKRPVVVPLDISMYLLSSCELYRVALRHMCSHESGLRLIGTESEVREDLDLLEQCKPSLILIDVALLGNTWIQTCEETIRSLSNLAHVIILAAQANTTFACTAIVNGASGYLLTSLPMDNFIQALHIVAAGGIWLGPDLMHALTTMYSTHTTAPMVADTHAVRLLSQREHQILNSVARGATSKEIAKDLYLSESSVRTYWYRVMSKLNALNKAEAIARATRLGLLDTPQDDDEMLLGASPQLRALVSRRLQNISYTSKLPA